MQIKVTDTAKLKEHLKLDKAGIPSLTAALLEVYISRYHAICFSSETTWLILHDRDSTSTSPTKTQIDSSLVRRLPFLRCGLAMTDIAPAQDVFQYVENKLWWYSI